MKKCVAKNQPVFSHGLLFKIGATISSALSMPSGWIGGCSSTILENLYPPKGLSGLQQPHGHRGVEPRETGEGAIHFKLPASCRCATRCYNPLQKTVASISSERELAATLYGKMLHTSWAPSRTALTCHYIGCDTCVPIVITT